MFLDLSTRDICWYCRKKDIALKIFDLTFSVSCHARFLKIPDEFSVLIAHFFSRVEIGIGGAISQHRSLLIIVNIGNE